MLSQILESSLPEQIIILIIAALPIVELRGSIPVAMDVFHMSWQQSVALSIIGNLIPVPFLLLFYDSLASFVSRIKVGKTFLEWLYKRTRRQTGIIEKYKHIGLIVFVAIPFPGTGAWTASIVAHFLGIKFKHALIDIALGVIGAGVIVTALVLLGWIGAVIALAGIIALSLIGIKKRNTPR
jgi:uncharacterized membrane protein